MTGGSFQRHQMPGRIPAGFGFDWGGSLEVNESLRQIARRLYAIGHKVVIIPACGQEPSEAVYASWLQQAGVPFHVIRRVVVIDGVTTPEDAANGKVAAMVEHDCLTLYDDNDHNLAAVSAAGLCAVKVQGTTPIPWPAELKSKSRVYAFDIDETMETSNGPVTVQMLRDLRKEGHIVGLCGGLCRFVQYVPDWQNVISFTLNFDFGYNGWYSSYGLHSHIPKEIWLHCFQHATFPGAEEYILVGNVPGEKNSLGVVCGSDDRGAAMKAGWRFIRESDFAEGAR